jgi:prepilin-type processing-associated H-X9-DG protein
LVVIAIIAILAAILFPVFARVRENARRASCMSSMKQIALGFMQYVQDYDERFPLSSNRHYVSTTDGTSCGGDTQGRPQGAPCPYAWQSGMQPYLKSTQIYYCPSRRNKIRGTYFMDYAINANLADNFPQGNGGGFYKKLSGVSEPSLTVLNCEYYQGFPDWPFAGREVLFSTLDTTAKSTYSSIYDPTAGLKRHLDGANWSFVDGHVKWFKEYTTFSGSGKYHF